MLHFRTHKIYPFAVIYKDDQKCVVVFFYEYAALHFAASIGIAAKGEQDLPELKSRINFERNRFILQFQIKFL